MAISSKSPVERGYPVGRFARRLLVDEELNPRVVIAVGGWDSFAAIEPYLPEPTEDVTDSAFASGQILSITDSYNGGEDHVALCNLPEKIER